MVKDEININVIDVNVDNPNRRLKYSRSISLSGTSFEGAFDGEVSCSTIQGVVVSESVIETAADTSEGDVSRQVSNAVKDVDADASDNSDFDSEDEYAPIVAPERSETMTLQEFRERLKQQGAKQLKHILNRPMRSNLVIVDILKSCEVNSTLTVSPLILPMMELFNSRAFRVKRLENRPDDERETSFPTSDVWNCNACEKTAENGPSSLKPEEWTAAFENMKGCFQRNLTDINSPECGHEPDLDEDISCLLAQGMKDLCLHISTLMCAGQQKKSVEWQGQVILRSPDDTTCSDGPPFHIDEHFYYNHSVISWLSDATHAIDIRDEILEGENIPNETSDAVIPHGVSSASTGSIGPSQPSLDRGFSISSDKNDSTKNDAENENDSVVQKSGPRLSEIRKFCLLEHEPGTPRTKFEKRFGHNKSVRLQKTEVKKVLAPVVGRDMIFYHGGEDCGQQKPDSNVHRPAIHQGPPVNPDFRKYGRVSFFFAMFDWC